MPLVFWADTLLDLLDDIRAGRIGFPESACVGFTSAQLLACHTWHDLSQVPGLVDWYNSQVNYWQRYWATEVAEEVNRVLALVPAGPKRRIAAKAFSQYCGTVENTLRACGRRLPVDNAAR